MDEGRVRQTDGCRHPFSRWDSMPDSAIDLALVATIAAAVCAILARDHERHRAVCFVGSPDVVFCERATRRLIVIEAESQH